MEKLLELWHTTLGKFIAVLISIALAFMGWNVAMILGAFGGEEEPVPVEEGVEEEAPEETQAEAPDEVQDTEDEEEAPAPEKAAEEEPAATEVAAGETQRATEYVLSLDTKGGKVAYIVDGEVAQGSTVTLSMAAKHVVTAVPAAGVSIKSLKASGASASEAVSTSEADEAKAESALEATAEQIKNAETIEIAAEAVEAEAAIDVEVEEIVEAEGTEPEQTDENAQQSEATEGAGAADETEATEPAAAEVVAENEGVVAQGVMSPAFEGYAYVTKGALFGIFGGHVVTVKVTAGEGVVPEGTTVQATLIDPSQYAATIEAMGASASNATLVDINLIYNGEAIQPNGAVNVCLFDPDVEGDNISVVHFDGDSANAMKARQADEECVSFDTNHFSTYGVMGFGPGGGNTAIYQPASITATSINNASVAYLYWHTEAEASSAQFTSISGGNTLTLDGFNSATTGGCIIFFVSPADNYILTGLGANGAGDLFTVGSGNYGTLGDYPGVTTAMDRALAAGYSAAFGWSRFAGNSSKVDGSFTVNCQSPDLVLAASSNKTSDVVPNEELTFTVTLTPQTTGSGKDSVEGVQVTQATINGVDVTSSLASLTKNSNGTYTGTVKYTATQDDCDEGSVILTVKASVTYSGTLAVNNGTVTTGSTISKQAQVNCNIAPKSKVNYRFKSNTAGKALPDEVQKLRPEDSDSFYTGQNVTAATPAKTKVDVEDGYWEWKGWAPDSSQTVTEDGVTFTGAWEFTEYTYDVKYHPGTNQNQNMTKFGVNDVSDQTVGSPQVAGGNNKIAKDSSGKHYLAGWITNPASAGTNGDIVFNVGNNQNQAVEFKALKANADSGWTECGAVFTMPANDVHYYAVWASEELVKTYTVTYDLNGGNINGNAANVVKSGLQYDDAAPSVTEPAKTGYEFAGWKSSVDNQVYKSTLPKVTQDVTYTAQWTARYKVTYQWSGLPEAGVFDASGNNITPQLPVDNNGYDANATYSVDSTFSSDSEVVAYENGVKVGTYKFSGWTDPNNGTMPANNVTISGSWTYVHTVTFNLNDQQGTAPTAQEITDGANASKPTDPKADGYTFGGWYTDSDCTTAYDFNTPVTQNITLYAKWTAIVPVYVYAQVYYGGELITDQTKLDALNTKFGTHFVLNSDGRDTSGQTGKGNGWCTVGKIKSVPGLAEPSATATGDVAAAVAAIKTDGNFVAAYNGAYDDATEHITGWTLGAEQYGAAGPYGEDPYVVDEYAWHLAGTFNFYTLTTETVGNAKINNDSALAKEYLYDATNKQTVEYSATQPGYSITSVTLDGVEKLQAGQKVAYGTTGTLEVDKTNNHKVVVTATPDTATYIVEYYKQGADGTYPTTATDTSTARDTEIGKSESVTDADKAKYNNEGYTFDESYTGNVVSGTVHYENGTLVPLVLKLYFKGAGSLAVTKTSEITDATGAVKQTAASGDTITYTITVTNTGNINVNSIAVTDNFSVQGVNLALEEQSEAQPSLLSAVVNFLSDLTGAADNGFSLAPDASKTFTATYTVTDEDIIAGAAITNSATASGKDSNNNDVSDTSDTVSNTVDTLNRSLNVTKTSAITKAEGNNGADKATIAQRGDTITYTITVKNDGNVTVSGIVVTDSMANLTVTSGDLNVGTLAPGAESTITATHVVTEADIIAAENATGEAKNKISNTATASGKDAKNNQVSANGTATDSIDPMDTTVSVRKTAELTKAAANNDEAKATIAQIGDTITYTIKVKNNGNVTVSGIVVTDSMANLTVTSGDLNVGTLAPGAESTITATHVVTEDDIKAATNNDSKIKNTATATGTDPNDVETKGSGDVETPAESEGPALAITKTSNTNKEKVKVGDTITYTITVTNTGNVTVNSIALKDALTNGEDAVALKQATADAAVTSLAPGQIATATTTYKVTEQDILAGSITNEAVVTGTGSDKDSTSIEKKASCKDETVAVSNNLAVKKTSSVDANTKVKVGDTITYTITVTNNGNVTAKDVVVTDTFSGKGDAIDLAENTQTADQPAPRSATSNGATVTIESLAPGASKTYTATYTVVEADLAADSIENAVTASGTNGKEDEIKGKDEVSNSTDNVFKVTYVNYDGTTLQGPTEVKYGAEIPEYAGATPTKPSDDVNNYNFSGWKLTEGTEGANNTMGATNLIYTAQYDADKIPVYDLTIKYVFKDGSKAKESYVDQLKEGTYYSITSPKVEGYTPDRAVVTGTMAAESKIETVVYAANDHTVTVQPVDENGNKLGDPVVQGANYGEKYSVATPTIEGYTATKSSVDGTMGDKDVYEEVVYTLNKHDVTLQPVDEDGKKIADPVVKSDVAYGTKYEIASPSIEGYTATKDGISGTMPDKDVYEEVVYKINKHTVTIQPVDENGNPIGEPTKTEVEYGKDYDIDTPDVPGYTTDQDKVSGTMGDEDVTVEVTYKPEPKPDTDGGGTKPGKDDNDKPGKDNDPDLDNTGANKKPSNGGDNGDNNGGDNGDNSNGTSGNGTNNNGTNGNGTNGANANGTNGNDNGNGDQDVDENGNPTTGAPADCFIHFYMILGLILTMLYGGGVVGRRRSYTTGVDKLIDAVTKKNN